MTPPRWQHPDKVFLKKVLSILTQRNDLLLVADKDPGVRDFYDKGMKAESMELSNPIVADYFKEKKKEDKRVVANVDAWRRSSYPYSVRTLFRFGGSLRYLAPPYWVSAGFPPSSVPSAV
ncbi:hypothetical protein Q1695_012555 [Nippostrongylus brasiliensis]|nr:hypothetical protein Q1695_012555 [Nippostrongylus brasiliensis]